MGSSSGFPIAYSRCSWVRFCDIKTADKIKVAHYRKCQTVAPATCPRTPAPIEHLAFDFSRREDCLCRIDVPIGPTRTREPRRLPSRGRNVSGCGHRRCWSYRETDFGTTTEVPGEALILLPWC